MGVGEVEFAGPEEGEDAFGAGEDGEEGEEARGHEPVEAVLDGEEGADEGTAAEEDTGIGQGGFFEGEAGAEGADADAKKGGGVEKVE